MSTPDNNCGGKTPIELVHPWQKDAEGKYPLDTDAVRNFFALAATDTKEANKSQDQFVDYVRYQLTDGRKLDVKSTGIFGMTDYFHGHPEETTLDKTFEVVVRDENETVTAGASFFFPINKDGGMIAVSDAAKAGRRAQWSHFSPLIYGASKVPLDRFDQVSIIFGAIAQAQRDHVESQVVKAPVFRGPRF